MNNIKYLVGTDENGIVYRIINENEFRRKQTAIKIDNFIFGVFCIGATIGCTIAFQMLTTAIKNYK
jgi:hypothetical protein